MKVRLIIFAYFEGDFYVSIHAPVKVRLYCSCFLFERMVSIHAPVKVRQQAYRTDEMSFLFQFTHP